MRQSIVRANSIIYSRSIGILEELKNEDVRRWIPGQATPPLWQIGHLLLFASSCLKYMGSAPVVSEHEEPMFANGSKFDPDGNYPPYEEMLLRFKEAHAARAVLYAEVDESVLAQPIPAERLRSFLPAVGDAIVFLMTSHESYHFAQIVGWRRAATQAAVT